MSFFDAIGYCVMLKPGPITLYVKKSHVVPHFDCLDVTNAVVSFMMLFAWFAPSLVPMASHDQKICCTLFWSSWAEKCSCAIYNTMSIMMLIPAPNASYVQKIMLHVILITFTTQMEWSHWFVQYHMVLMLVPLTSHGQKSYCIFFWSSWPSKLNGAFDDTVGIMWHWTSTSAITWHKRLMLQIVSVILTKWIQWCHWQCHGQQYQMT